MKIMERLENWWTYHKATVIVGMILLWILVDLLRSTWKARVDAPDFQVAYVGSTPLGDDLIGMLETAFEAIAPDRNGDGKSLVRIQSYLLEASQDLPDAALAQLAADIRLTADIESRESMFFMSEDLERLQASYGILETADGTCPGANGTAGADQVRRLSVFSILERIALMEEAGFAVRDVLEPSAPELFYSLSIGRRCFHGMASDEDLAAADEFWDNLTGA